MKFHAHAMLKPCGRPNAESKSIVFVRGGRKFSTPSSCAVSCTRLERDEARVTVDNGIPEGWIATCRSTGVDCTWCDRVDNRLTKAPRPASISKCLLRRRSLDAESDLV